MERIAGTYPGGPRRAELRPDDADLAPVFVPRVAELESWVRKGQTRRRKKERARRVAIGFIVVVILAGGLGIYMGAEATQSADELVQAERERNRADALIGKEADRLINELWKMEDLERVRTPGGR